MAKVLVKASGWNILPSMPVSAKTGTKARMMMTMAKEMGRPTSARGVERDFPDVIAIVAVLLLVLFGLADDVFGHDDACVDEHADGDGDAAERHDVRRDACALHEEECAEHSERQRNRDDEDAAEMPEKKDVGERDEDDLFDQRVAQRVDGVIDEDAAVVERDDVDARREGRAESRRSSA